MSEPPTTENVTPESRGMNAASTSSSAQNLVGRGGRPVTASSSASAAQQPEVEGHTQGDETNPGYFLLRLQVPPSGDDAATGGKAIYLCNSITGEMTPLMMPKSGLEIYDCQTSFSKPFNIGAIHFSEQKGAFVAVYKLQKDTPKLAPFKIFCPQSSSFHLTKHYVYVGYNSGRIEAWNQLKADHYSVGKKANQHTGKITCMTTNSDGTRLISCADDRKMIIWTMSSGHFAEFKKTNSSQDTIPPFVNTEVIWLPTDQIITVAECNGKIFAMVWSSKTMEHEIGIFNHTGILDSTAYYKENMWYHIDKQQHLQFRRDKTITSEIEVPAANALVARVFTVDNMIVRIFKDESAFVMPADVEYAWHFVVTPGRTHGEKYSSKPKAKDTTTIVTTATVPSTATASPTADDFQRMPAPISTAPSANLVSRSVAPQTPVVNPKDWQTADVAKWLQDHELGIYASKFKEELVSGDLLLQLTDEDLADIVTSHMHRLRIKSEIAKLINPLNTEVISRGPTVVVTEWNTADVVRWLKNNELELYVDVFRQHLVNGEMLLQLTDEDLKTQFTVTKKSHRIRILDEIEFLSRPPGPVNHQVETWNTARVVEWANANELVDYAPRFKEELVNGRMLIEFSDEDLAEFIGVTKSLHRRRIGTEILKIVNPSLLLQPAVIANRGATPTPAATTAPGVEPRGLGGTSNATAAAFTAGAPPTPTLPTPQLVARAGLRPRGPRPRGPSGPILTSAAPASQKPETAAQVTSATTVADPNPSRLVGRGGSPKEAFLMQPDHPSTNVVLQDAAPTRPSITIDWNARHREERHKQQWISTSNLHEDVKEALVDYTLEKVLALKDPVKFEEFCYQAGIHDEARLAPLRIALATL